jgi:hypothetical protein
MTQTPKGLQSTKETAEDTATDSAYAAACAAVYTTKEEYDAVYAAAFVPDVAQEVHLVNLSLETLFTDCIGRFPVRSVSGNQHVMCAYHVGANVILVKAYQTKHDRHQIPAYSRIMEQLKQTNVQVKMQVLDNEVSAKYIKTITEKWKKNTS